MSVTTTAILRVAESTARGFLGRGQLPPDVDCEDLIQEICVELLRADPDDEPLAQTIATTTCRRVLGRHRSMTPIPEGYDVPDVDTTSELLESLPGKYRRILELRHVDRRTLAEVATILGVTVHAVRSIEDAALRRLRSLLARPDDA